jgi:RNA polymerase sigma factor (sigma-70 family)
MEKIKIEDHTKLVWIVYFKMNPFAPSYSMEDWYQVGLEGLHKAIINFDPSLGYKFSTYAIFLIEQSFQLIFRVNSRKRDIPKNNVYALDADINSFVGAGTWRDTILDERPTEDQILSNKAVVIFILSCATNDKERLYIRNLMGKLSQYDIAERLKIKQSNVSLLITKFKKTVLLKVRSEFGDKVELYINGCVETH